MFSKPKRGPDLTGTPIHRGKANAREPFPAFRLYPLESKYTMNQINQQLTYLPVIDQMLAKACGMKEGIANGPYWYKDDQGKWKTNVKILRQAGFLEP